MCWEGISAISTAFSALVILLTALFAVWQIIEMRNSRKFDAFINVQQILQNEDTRAARNMLLGKLAEKEFKKWTDDEIKQAEKACHTYDVVGFMSRKKYVSEKIVTEEWHNSIIKSWEAARPMIEEYKKKRGNDFWGNFEELYRIAKKHEKKVSTTGRNKVKRMTKRRSK